MAHEIQNNALTGLAEIAYTGEKPWHGLGQVLQQDASIEDWIVAAGMAWEVAGTPVRYATEAASAATMSTFVDLFKTHYKSHYFSQSTN